MNKIKYLINYNKEKSKIESEIEKYKLFRIDKSGLFNKNANLNISYHYSISNSGLDDQILMGILSIELDKT